MDSKIYIIHRSPIVQCGLTAILQNNFKCNVVKAFANFDEFKIAEESNFQNSLIFIDESQANSTNYIEFVGETSNVTSICITNCNEEKTTLGWQFSISIYSSVDEIYEQIKEFIELPQINIDDDDDLTNREIEVLKLVALGYANKEIADKLFISTHTVMSHRKNITEKLGIKSISGLTVYAIINNYIDTTNLDVKNLI